MHFRPIPGIHRHREAACGRWVIFSNEWRQPGHSTVAYAVVGVQFDEMRTSGCIVKVHDSVELSDRGWARRVGHILKLMDSVNEQLGAGDFGRVLSGETNCPRKTAKNLSSCR